jgi:AcrR family transcriptional regulator
MSASIETASDEGQRMNDVRERLIRIAVGLLREGGRDAVRVRPLAERLGTSTKAIYQHVGGMPQLMLAVAEEGFVRLHAALREVEPGRDPVTDLGRLALRYRGVALADPALFGLMFEPGTAATLRRTARSPTAPDPVERVVGELRGAVERARDAGRIRPRATDLAAVEVWTVTHGLVGLELRGALRPDLTDLLVPVLVGLGDEHRRARRSLDAAVPATVD